MSGKSGIHSMSGHGRGESASGTMTCIAECTSVNRKGIEVSVTLPRGLAALEPRVREFVQGRFSRGRITVSILLEHGEDPGEIPPCIDTAVARRRYREFEALRDALGLTDPVTLAMLVAAPGVLRQTVPESVDAEAVWKTVLRALESSVKSLEGMRRTEGAHLAADLLKRVRKLEADARFIRRRIPVAAATRRQLMTARLREAGAVVGHDDPALLRELATIAERADITEELTRIESHAAQFRSVVEAGGPVGRTLDYLAQELFREFNTLGNKAADAPVSQRVVQSKAELDRIREQAANLE
jgi:uncharacterized protein (TIGR00255 family)